MLLCGELLVCDYFVLLSFRGRRLAKEASDAPAQILPVYKLLCVVLCRLFGKSLTLITPRVHSISYSSDVT